MCIWRYIHLLFFFVCFVLFCGIHVYRDLKGYQIKCISSFKCIEAVMKYLYLSWVFFSFLFLFLYAVFFNVFHFNQLPNELMAKSLMFLFFFVWFCTRFKLNIKIFCVFFIMFEQILNWKSKEGFPGGFSWVFLCLIFNQWNENI